MITHLGAAAAGRSTHPKLHTSTILLVCSSKLGTPERLRADMNVHFSSIQMLRNNTLHYSSLPTEGPREGSFPLIYHRMHPSYFYTLNNVFFGKQLPLLCERAPHTLVLPTPCQVLSGGLPVSKLLPLCHISQKCACLQKMLFIAESVTCSGLA